MAKSKAKAEPESADAAAARLSTPTPRVPAIPDADLLSTGSTLFNLALSGRPNGGVPVGTYVYFVGDSSSGKTWASFLLFAEAAVNPRFDGYRFIFDNAENGALMDVERYFGQGVAARLEPPMTDAKDRPVYSGTVQEFYYHLDLAIRAGPCIYVLDSMDALNDDADDAKFEAEVHKYATGKGDIPGSMGMAKAKTNSKNINRVARALRTNGSILVVVSQTRDKVGGTVPGLKTRAGGRALKFFAHVEVWTSVRAPITKTYMRKEREVGSTIRLDVQKNRVCGWEGRFELPFLKGYGIDDVGSCVDYLIDERHWRKPEAPKGAKPDARRAARADDEEEDGGGVFAAPEFEFVGRREALVKKIQDADAEPALRVLVARVWNEIIAGAAPARKPRY